MEGTSRIVECSQHFTPRQLGKAKHRCIQLGLGSSLQGCDYRGTMVPAGEHLPHQLSRDAGSLPSSQMFHKEGYPLIVYVNMDNTTAISYLNHRGGTISPSLYKLAKETWAVHVSEYHVKSKPPTATSQHGCRQRV